MPVTLLGAAEVRALAADLGVTPTKKLGQNFVVDANTVRKIVHLAGVQAGEHVVEVGPGLGSLTLAILETGAEVTAVEIDHRLAERLPATASAHGVPQGALRVIDEDALRVVQLPGEPEVLVANLPYNVSVPVLLHFLETFRSIVRGVVMVQAEVGERLAALPGSKVYGAPTRSGRRPSARSPSASSTRPFSNGARCCARRSLAFSAGRLPRHPPRWSEPGSPRRRGGRS